MKVVRWVQWSEAALMPNSIDRSGGWFTAGMRWSDYMAETKAEFHPRFEALREEVLRLQLKEGGDWHQNSEEGVPVFEDETAATFTYRGWGDLLAAIWAEAEGKDYHYMDFYMSRLVPGRPRSAG